MVAAVWVSETRAQKGGAKGAMRNRGGKGGGSNRGGRGRNVEDEWDGQCVLGPLWYRFVLQSPPSSSTTTTVSPGPVSASATSWSSGAAPSRSSPNTRPRRGRPVWGCVTGTGWRDWSGDAGDRNGRRRGRFVLEPVTTGRRNKECWKRRWKGKGRQSIRRENKTIFKIWFLFKVQSRYFHSIQRDTTL